MPQKPTLTQYIEPFHVEAIELSMRSLVSIKLSLFLFPSLFPHVFTLFRYFSNMKNRTIILVFF